MKIAVFSDIHHELKYWFPKKLDAGIVVLAGYIDIKQKSIEFAKKCSAQLNQDTW